MDRASKNTRSPEIAARPKRARRAIDSPNGRHLVAAHEIARLAYELYEARGGGDGGQLDDWLEAERQLLTRGGA
jgi:hypothetical protein